MRATLFILIYFGLAVKCYCQTYTQQGIDFGENKYKKFSISKNGSFTGVFQTPKDTKKSANNYSNTTIYKAEIIIWDNLKNELSEKFEFELPSTCFQWEGVVFTDDNKFVYGNNSCGGYYIFERETKNVFIGEAKSVGNNYTESFEIIGYTNGIFHISSNGTAYYLDKKSGQNLTKNEYNLLDCKLIGKAIKILAKRKEAQAKTVYAGKSHDENKFEEINKEITYFFNDQKIEKIYTLSENEKCLSRNYNPTNSTISLIINTEKERYNAKGKIVIYTLIQHKVTNEIPINIAFEGWIQYHDNCVQTSKDLKFAIYNDGSFIRKIDLYTHDNSVLFKLDKGYCPRFVLNDLNNKVYYQIADESSTLGIYELEKKISNQGLSVIFNLPKVDNINSQNNKTNIDVCISNPNNISYKEIEYYLNNNKQSNRDFEIVKNNCVSSFKKEVNLENGQNSFEVVVLDNSGKEINREKRVINYIPKQIVTPIVNPVPKILTEKRLALIVGNGKYDNGNNLPNATNDADSLDIVLTSLNFKVIKIKNQSKQQLETAIINFAVQLKDYDVGLFFYAGHGMEFNGENYIIPTDAEKLDKSDVQYRCVSTSWLQEKMAEAGAYNKTNIVILDACRNNPFRSWRSFDESNIWTPPSNIPTGTIIEYAASQGQKASDGIGSNGLYTSILLKHIKTRGLEIEKVFKRVRIDLKQKGGQDPVEINQLTNDFYFLK